MTSDDGELLHENDLDSLPQEILGALAIRCAKRVLPFYHRLWSEPGEHWNGLNDTVRDIERALRESTTPPFSDKPRKAVAAAKEMLAGLDQHDDPVIAVTWAAECVLAAFEVVHAEHQMIASTLKSVQLARLVEVQMNAGPQISNAITHDLNLGQHIVNAGFSADFPGLSLDLLGPLWPLGEPSDWPVCEESSADVGLYLSIEVEDDARRLPAVLRGLVDLVLKVDGLHRLYGGHGLKVDTLDLLKGVTRRSVLPS